MADLIVVAGVKPYDGEYELDVEHAPFTTLEWRWVKKIAGYLPLTIGEGMAGADPDLFCAFAVIAMRRAGKIDKDDALSVAERLADAPFGSAITIEGDKDEVEEDVPLGLTDAPPPLSEPKPISRDDLPSRQPPSSGNGSPTSSDPPGNDPSPTGTIESDTPLALTVLGQAI